MTGPGPLYPFFEWCETTILGETVRASTWLFPVIEAFHLVAFAAIGGMILLVDLRLLGVVFRGQKVAQLAREVRPWFLGSLGTMLISGILLFLSEAVKCYYNEPFWDKMRFLGLAIVFTFTVRRKIIGGFDDGRIKPIVAAVVGLVSLVLWGGVAWGGRWIGFWG